MKRTVLPSSTVGAHTHAEGDVTSLTADLAAKASAAALTTHTSDTANPHSVTKTQVGLGNVTNNAQLVAASNLSDVASASTSRTNLGLGGAAVLAVGTTAGTVAAGDDLRISASLLTSGEETMSRENIASSTLTITSGNLRLSYFTARKSETTTQVRVMGGSTAAAATPTLIRVGLYLIDSGGSDGTLVASTASDTALFAAASTSYTKSWSSSYAKVAGQRYAIGILVVTAAAAPSLLGVNIAVATEAALAPRLTGSVASQSDLPSSISSPSGSSSRFYAAVLP